MNSSSKIESEQSFVELCERVARMEVSTAFIAEAVKHLDKCLDEHKDKQAARDEMLEARVVAAAASEFKRERKHDRLWTISIILVVVGPFLAGSGKISLSTLIDLLQKLSSHGS